jgi:hypothetical protein
MTAHPNRRKLVDRMGRLTYDCPAEPSYISLTYDDPVVG